MNTPVGGRRWLLLAGAIALLAGMVTIRQRRVPEASARDRVAALRAEFERLRDCDELHVRSEREALARRRAGVRLGLPEWRPTEPSGLRWTAASDRWPAIVAALRVIESAPLQQLEIRTRGSLTRREIAGVEVVLARPAATPPRPESGAASAARTEGNEAEAGAAPRAARAGPRPPNLAETNQP